MDTILPSDFREFLKLLNYRNVRYVLIGGYAVAYHGYSRATADMDLWIDIDPANAARVVSVLRAVCSQPSRLRIRRSQRMNRQPRLA